MRNSLEALLRTKQSQLNLFLFEIAFVLPITNEKIRFIPKYFERFDFPIVRNDLLTVISCQMLTTAITINSNSESHFEPNLCSDFIQLA
jgi:hypothetical protein